MIELGEILLPILHGMWLCMHSVRSTPPYVSYNCEMVCFDVSDLSWRLGLRTTLTQTGANHMGKRGQRVGNLRALSFLAVGAKGAGYLTHRDVYFPHEISILQSRCERRRSDAEGEGEILAEKKAPLSVEAINRLIWRAFHTQTKSLERLPATFSHSCYKPAMMLSPRELLVTQT